MVLKKYSSRISIQLIESALLPETRPNSSFNKWKSPRNSKGNPCECLIINNNSRSRSSKVIEITSWTERQGIQRNHVNVYCKTIFNEKEY